MKHKKIAFAWIGILMIVVFSMSGCKSESNGKSAANTATPTPGAAVKTDDMAEQWVYIHDRTVPAMIFFASSMSPQWFADISAMIKTESLCIVHLDECLKAAWRI